MYVLGKVWEGRRVGRREGGEGTHLEDQVATFPSSLIDGSGNIDGDQRKVNWSSKLR